MASWYVCRLLIGIVATGIVAISKLFEFTLEEFRAVIKYLRSYFGFGGFHAGIVHKSEGQVWGPKTCTVS